MIELKHLKTLILLEETGHLVHCAKRLHVTQSALSHQLHKLEEQLGSKLFERKTTPIQFTDAGKVLLNLAKETLPKVDEALARLEKINRGDAGQLNIAIECHTCFQWLLPTLNHFRKAWPQVDVDITSHFHFEPLPQVASGDLDVVITSDPQQIVGVEYLPLFEYENQLAVANDHPLTTKPYIKPTDLADEVLITYPVERARLDVFTRFLNPKNIEPKRVRTAELTLMIMQLVATHQGVASLPNWALVEYSDKSYLQVKRLGKEGLWSSLYLAFSKHSQKTAFLNSFIELAKTTTKEHLIGIREK